MSDQFSVSVENTIIKHLCRIISNIDIDMVPLVCPFVNLIIWLINIKLKPQGGAGRGLFVATAHHEGITEMFLGNEVHLYTQTVFILLAQFSMLASSSVVKNEVISGPW